MKALKKVVLYGCIGLFAYYANDFGGWLYRQNHEAEQEKLIRVRPPLTLEKMVVKSAEHHGIRPELLKALVLTESSWRPDVVSHMGATGLTQVMPITARDVCGIVDIDLLKIPQIGADCGAEILARHIKERGSEYDGLREYYCGFRTAFVRKYKGCHDYAKLVLSRI